MAAWWSVWPRSTRRRSWSFEVAHAGGTPVWATWARCKPCAASSATTGCVCPSAAQHCKPSVAGRTSSCLPSMQRSGCKPRSLEVAFGQGIVAWLHQVAATNWWLPARHWRRAWVPSDQTWTRILCWMTSLASNRTRTLQVSMAPGVTVGWGLLSIICSTPIHIYHMVSAQVPLPRRTAEGLAPLLCQSSASGVAQDMIHVLHARLSGQRWKPRQTVGLLQRSHGQITSKQTLDLLKLVFQCQALQLHSRVRGHTPN
mmetsp:Transcript_3814/g.12150  ORF Transcript_3814/g.12150 Transcript_3814/m.12150 type:complete len:257 (-) Transcript_3814:1006-1776(-)